MIKLGVFILPSKKLKKKIISKKKDIKRKFGNQKYLNHLPHCTLCVIYTSRKSLNTIVKDEVFKYQNKKEAKIKKFDITSISSDLKSSDYNQFLAFLNI